MGRKIVRHTCRYYLVSVSGDMHPIPPKEIQPDDLTIGEWDSMVNSNRIISICEETKETAPHERANLIEND